MYFKIFSSKTISNLNTLFVEHQNTMNSMMLIDAKHKTNVVLVPVQWASCATKVGIEYLLSP